jgi:methyltransferase (TIGR00027 family)
MAKRSRTAQGVTAERTLLAKMGVIDDRYAPAMLTPAWKVFVGIVDHWPTSTPPWSVARAGLAARVLWYDEQLRASLDGGVQQVAIIGAGYDTRAWRFRQARVSFFELDHAVTQADKRRRAPGPGPTYVEADLATDDAGQALVSHGLNHNRSTHFIVEGVTMYLPEDVVRHQLAGLANVSGAGSRLCVDFYPPADAGTSRDRRLRRAQHLARTGSGEKLRLQVEPQRAVDLLVASGWDVDEVTSMRAAALRLVSHDVRLPLHGISEHKTLVACSIG